MKQPEKAAFFVDISLGSHNFCHGKNSANNTGCIARWLPADQRADRSAPARFLGGF